jgi:hypothetical protein
MALEMKYFHEQIFFSTVRITIPEQTGIGASMGTGFLLRKPLTKDPSRTVILLISNKHVFKDPKGSIALNFHQKDLDGNPILGQTANLSQSDFTNLYTGHPDNDVDLACLNVSFIANPPNSVYFKNITADMFSDFSEEHFLPGNNIWFIGYPENRYDLKNNLPILRRGYISSIPKIDFNGKKQFIIDAQVFPGSSGSPVFVEIDDHFVFCGIIVETMIKNELLRAVPVSFNVGVQQMLGLGVVIKSTLIEELINEVEKNIV